MQKWRQFAVVAAVAAIVLFTNLGGSRLWDRDEPRNAGCAWEMLERNDWVTPIQNAELRAHKPVLLYWLMMIAYTAFGVNEFSARFWSALLAVGTALCTCALGSRLFNARVGVWSGVIISTCLMFDVAGRAATPDSALIFFATLALTIYVLGTLPVRDGAAAGDGAALRCNSTWLPGTWYVFALMYAAMGLAVLAKGPIGLVLPTAVIGLFLLIVRRPEAERSPNWKGTALSVLRTFGPRHFLRTCWAMRPVTALAVAMAIALPWYVWVGVRTDGEFLRGFFLEHHFGRATSAMEGHHGSLLFYPVAILVGFFPWSVFAAPVALDAVARVRRRDSASVALTFAACWIGVYVGLFTLARTKLPSYVTPCYPALALVTGCFFDHWVQRTTLVRQLWPRLALGTYALVGLVMLAVLPLVLHELLPGEDGLAALGIVPLSAGVFCLMLLRRQRWAFAAHTFAFSAVVFVVFLFAVATARIDRHQQSHVLLATINGHAADARVAAFGCLEPSWVFYARKPIEELALHADDVDRPLPGNPWRPKPRMSVEAFLESSPRPYIITSDEYLERLQQASPAELCVLAKVPYFLRNRELFILGKNEVPARTATTSSGDSRRH